MILPFRQFNAKILTQLNKLVDVVNSLDNMRGDGLINVKRSGAGTTIGVSLGQLRPRLSGSGSGSSGDSAGGSSVRRAKCTADAGSGATIAATLYDGNGEDSTAITVYCSIANGSDLDEATPRLEEDLDIFVTKSTYDNAGTPESRWYCTTVFQTTEDCTCGT